MKYRIKDPDVVKGFKILGWTYEFDEDDVKRYGFYWHGDCRNKIYFDPCEEFYVEPVKELAEGWNPYPERKPQVEGKYLCVWRYDPDDSIEQTVIEFRYEKFRDWDSKIFGWRELPEVWKEEK